VPEGGADYDSVAARATAHRLEIFGAFHPGPDDGAPAGTATLLLLGPAEPGFWAHLTAQPEFADRAPDPLDRWSRRVIGRMACDLGGKALFLSRARPGIPSSPGRSVRAAPGESPVRFLVHDTAGLMVSYRGAIGLRERIALPPPPAAPPCAECERPCLSACPVGALTADGYDTAACHAYPRHGRGTRLHDRRLRRPKGLPRQPHLWSTAGTVGVSHEPVPPLTRNRTRAPR
jgi:epoxyqueuosine reductase